MITSLHQRKAMNIFRQQDVLVITELDYCKVKVKARPQLKRWKMIKFCPRKRIAKTKSRLGIIMMNNICHTTRMAKNKFRQTRSKSITKNFQSNGIHRFPTFRETDGVTLFTNKNYKYVTSFGLTGSRMRSIKGVFGACARPSLLR